MKDRITATFVAGVLGCTLCPVWATELPAGLTSPHPRVVCNAARGICYDRMGPSIGLTEAFLGRSAAERLTAAMRAEPPGQRARFSPAPAIECVRESGPCTADGQAEPVLSAILFGPYEARPMPSAEVAAMTSGEWRWMMTRYGNDSEVRPADPARYRLQLRPDGSVRLKADCNAAGGEHRIAGSTIAISITHSTMAACEPGSLEAQFRRDLEAAAVLFLRGGRLYLDLKYDAGTMEFDR